MAKALTLEEFRNSILELADGNNFEVLRVASLEDLNKYDFKSSKTRYFVVKHNECGKEFLTTRSRMFKSIYKCPHCAYRKRSENLKDYNKEKFLNFFDSVLSPEYTLLSEYTKDKEHITLRHNCLDCGNYEFKILPYNLKKQR